MIPGEESMKRIRGLSAVWFLTFAIVAAVAIAWSVEVYADLNSRVTYGPNKTLVTCVTINGLDEESYDHTFLTTYPREFAWGSKRRAWVMPVEP